MSLITNIILLLIYSLIHLLIVNIMYFIVNYQIYCNQIIIIVNVFIMLY